MSASIIAANWRRQTKVFERQHSHTLSVWQQYGRRLTPISVHGAPFRRVCLDCAMKGKVWPGRLKVRRSGRQPANGGVYARPENSAAQPTISIETDRNRWPRARFRPSTSSFSFENIAFLL
ncbi:MAG: hypothetical protein USCAAHI_02953 [Beijerinckiaceae bacterium]|nr:MAG: hypothetical protein USCAAHI_02953 [Beijerinckiaceae bacterium]